MMFNIGCTQPPPPNGGGSSSGGSSGTRCAQDGSDYSYSELVSGSTRTISFNGCPNHPSYNLNPNYAVKSSLSYTVPSTPQFVGSSSSSSAASASLSLAAQGGAVGVFFNGAQLYSPYGGQQYGSVTGFSNAATFAEGNTFDQCGCHASQTTSASYHCHVPPSCLLKQLGEASSAHSPQVGWAFDGFPVYGPRGPGGVLMQACSVTGGTYGTAVCTDDCGGYYRNDGTIDKFVYRYYTMGSVGDGTSCNAPACPSPNASFHPHTPLCFRGCCPSGASCQSVLPSCGGTASAGTVTGYTASVPAINGLSLATGLPRNTAACSCSNLVCSTTCTQSTWSRSASCTTSSNSCASSSSLATTAVLSTTGAPAKASRASDLVATGASIWMIAALALVGKLP